jgi:hypothetical protein
VCELNQLPLQCCVGDHPTNDAEREKAFCTCACDLPGERLSPDKILQRQNGEVCCLSGECSRSDTYVVIANTRGLQDSPNEVSVSVDFDLSDIDRKTRSIVVVIYSACICCIL